jgi:hypothetical protein
MSHKPDTVRTPAKSTPPEVLPASHPLVLADYSTSESVEVELVDCPVSTGKPQPQVLVADYTCEV